MFKIQSELTPYVMRMIGTMVVPDEARSNWRRYGLAALLSCLGFLITWQLFGSRAAPFFSLFMTTVVLASLYGGRGPGLLATGLSTILGFLLVPPAWTLRVTDPADGVRTALFGVLGSVLAVVIGAIGVLQRKVNDQHELLTTTLRSIADAVITTDAEGRVTFLNPVAEKIIGWKSGEALRKPIEEILHFVNEQTQCAEVNPVCRVLQTRATMGSRGRSALAAENGRQIPVNFSAAPIIDDHHRMIGAVIVFRDASAQRQAQKILVQAEKLAAATKLASTLAHEVNNPLEAMLNLMFLVNLAEDLSKAKGFALTALEYGKRAAYFVHQTLSFAGSSDRQELLDLPSITQNVLSLHQNKISAKNARVVSRFGGSVLVRANCKEIQQVISNLLSNALDAIEMGGTVYMRIASTKSTVRLVVGDNGCGIPAHHLPELFQAFFTTKLDVGTGLGLWVTKRIIDAHKGYIQIRSSVGRGTVVRTALPVPN